MDRKRQAALVAAGLRRLYPDAHCELDFKTPLELLMATILSAQCTDKRVNEVTKTLFKRCRTAQDYARIEPAALEKIIRSAGFFRAKAKSIIETGKLLADKFGGRVPDRMDDLLTLRGVARKTANVVLGTAYGKASGVVVDTHIKRLAYRLNLTDEEDPVAVEKDLMELLPRKDWVFFGHALIWHGRRVCKAITPSCMDCGLNNVCPKRGV